MILSTTSVHALLNVSTSTTTYDTLIDYYIPIVNEDIMQIANHRYHDSYHWFYDDGFVFASSGTITLPSDSTEILTRIFKAGDTLDVQGSYLNDGLYTVSTVGTTQISVTSTLLQAENSTDYDITTMIYKCRYDWDIKRIASKMVWWNVQNTTSISGDIASISLGGYSVSYRDNKNNSYGLYPANLISGIKRVAGSL